MASGDIFADMFTNTGDSGFDVQPASGVKVVITFIGCSGDDCRMHLKNSSGDFALSSATSTSASFDMKFWINSTNMKLFITNTEYINFRTSTATKDFAYSGVEI